MRTLSAPWRTTSSLLTALTSKNRPIFRSVLSRAGNLPRVQSPPHSAFAARLITRPATTTAMETAVYTVKIGSRYGSEAKLQKKLAEKVGKNGFAVVAVSRPSASSRKGANMTTLAHRR